MPELWQLCDGLDAGGLRGRAIPCTTCDTGRAGEAVAPGSGSSAGLRPLRLRQPLVGGLAVQ
eukprot:2232804-Pyramimonas_sp.AAC.1